MPAPHNKGFQPGRSGNPAGRPKKGKSLTDLLTTYLNRKGEGDPVARKQKLVEELYHGAVGRVIRHPVTQDVEKVIPGDPSLLRYIFDRIDGRPEIFQNLDANIEGGGVLVVPGVSASEEEWEEAGAQGSDKPTP